MSEAESASAEGRPFEWWMTANFAMGAGFSAFMALLIPPYVTEVTSDAAAAGSVMAVISLAAVLGPVLGTFADRHGAHRIVMSLGVLGMAVGFAAFALPRIRPSSTRSIRSFSACRQRPSRLSDPCSSSAPSCRTHSRRNG